METPIKQQHPWGTRSVTYWITLALALGIIFIGARFILQPQVGAIGYGIPFDGGHDAVYGRIKGIRDIFSGVALLPLLMMRMRKAAAWVLTSAIAVPVADFLTVLSINGASDLEHLLVHGVTALVMVADSFLLFRTSKQAFEG